MISEAMASQTPSDGTSWSILQPITASAARAAIQGTTATPTDACPAGASAVQRWGSQHATAKSKTPTTHVGVDKGARNVGIRCNLSEKDDVADCPHSCCSNECGHG